MPLSGDLRWKEQIVPVLYSAVGLAEKAESAQLFSDQLCWFKANANPFSRCAYSECYQIQDTPTDEKWYAFLPIHPDYRKSCLESGMAGSVRMRLISEENRKWIHVTMTYRSPAQPRFRGIISSRRAPVRRSGQRSRWATTRWTLTRGRRWPCGPAPSGRRGSNTISCWTIRWRATPAPPCTWRTHGTCTPTAPPPPPAASALSGALITMSCRLTISRTRFRLCASISLTGLPCPSAL